VTQILPPRFTLADAERAHAEWGCNCGPGAIAAICGLTLDEVRPLLLHGDFERKRYTNPTLMLNVMASLHTRGKIKSWRVSKLGMPNGYGSKVEHVGWPSYGLARIQWEGPWTKPGVPMSARYRHTHWIGAASRGPGSLGIFDINCINNGTGWVSLKNWREITVPWILQECVPRADGRWHITHAVEIDLAAAELAA
jgi:hypothetical protein